MPINDDFFLLIVPLLKKNWRWRLRRENETRKMKKTLMLLRLLGNPRDWLNPIEVNSLSFILLTLKMTTMPRFLPFFLIWFPIRSYN